MGVMYCDCNSYAINQVIMNIAVSVYTCTCTLPAGALYVPAGPKEFVSGDRVKCDLDMEVLSIASAIGEGADDHIAMVRTCYIVCHILLKYTCLNINGASFYAPPSPNISAGILNINDSYNLHDY